MPAQGLVDRPHGGTAVDDKSAVVLWNNVGRGGGIIGGKFPDDFLKNILKGGQAQHIAVFIYHNAEPALTFLEVQ